MGESLKPLENFRIHYKSKPYRVLGKGRHSESLEELVFYKALYVNDRGALWVRPKEMFEELVEIGGVRLPRFRPASHLREIPFQVYQQISIPDFRDWVYLEQGGPIQRRAFDFFSRTKIMEVLAEFKPVLAGTIPLEIPVAGSDLDILCESADFDYFETKLLKSFAPWGFDRFDSESPDQAPARIFVCNSQDLPIEIFVQGVPACEQRAFLHLQAEARLLQIGGEKLRREIIDLKLSGLKTEPAFAQVFDLKGDPYKALLNLELGQAID